MNQDTIEFIKKQILRSGFPLELEMSGMLRNRGYDVTSGVYFFDNDQKKAREFDIEAVFPDRLTSSNFDFDNLWVFNPFLIMECKKSTRYGWVFFRSEPVNYFYDVGQSIDVFTEKSGYSKSAAFHVLSKNGLQNHAGAVYVSGYQQVSIDKSHDNNGRTGKNAILDAISKIIKVLDYKFQILRGFFSTDAGRRDIIFYFPVIVFDGQLFEASFDNSLELRESRHLVYETRYLSNLTKSLVPLYIHIVQKDAFEDVLSAIETTVHNINQFLEMTEAQTELNLLLGRKT